MGNAFDINVDLLVTLANGYDLIFYRNIHNSLLKDFALTVARMYVIINLSNTKCLEIFQALSTSHKI